MPFPFEVIVSGTRFFPTSGAFILLRLFADLLFILSELLMRLMFSVFFSIPDSVVKLTVIHRIVVFIFRVSLYAISGKSFCLISGIGVCSFNL